MNRRRAILLGIGILFIIITWILAKRRSRNLSTAKISEYELLIVEISEVIIPRTQTAGARDVKIEKYISNYIESCLPYRDKQTVLKGLFDIDEYCRREYLHRFKDCTNLEKVATLEYFQNHGRINNVFIKRLKRKIFGRSFFELIKDLTVMGYCTSEIGVTRGLAYDHVPGNYVACMPLLSGQRSWATS